MIELIAVDLDGTLLKNDKSISQENLSALRDAHSRGAEIVIITGRPFSGVPDFLLRMPQIRYVISNNGACVADVAEGRLLHSCSIPNKRALELIRQLHAAGFLIEVFADGRGYLENELMEKYNREFGNSPVGEYIRSCRQAVPSLERLFEQENKTADEIFIVAGSSEERDRIALEYSASRDIWLCRLASDYLEITNKGANKGEALKWLCSFLEIPLQSVLAMGDGENDAELLRCAGIGAAMGNAPEAVKACADIITLSNEENGVAKAIYDCFKIY